MKNGRVRRGDREIDHAHDKKRNADNDKDDRNPGNPMIHCLKITNTAFEVSRP